MRIAIPDSAAPAESPSEQVSRSEIVRRFLQGDLVSLRVIFAIALIWIVFQSQNDRFLSATNLTNLFLQITPVGLISVGVVLALLLGEIDLSIGAVSGLAAAVMAVLNVQHGWDPALAIVAGVLTGAAIGLAQGLLFTRFRIPSFVVTLAGLLAWQGALLQVLGNTGTVNLTNSSVVEPRQHLLLGHRGLDHRRGGDRRLRPRHPGRLLRRRAQRRHRRAARPARPAPRRSSPRWRSPRS